MCEPGRTGCGAAAQDAGRTCANPTRCRRCRCRRCRRCRRTGLEWRGRAHSGLDDSRNTAALAARMARDGAVLRVTDSFREQLPQAQQAQQQGQQGQQQGQGQQGQQGQGQGQQGQQGQAQQGQQGQGQQEQGQGATEGEAAGAGAGDSGEGPVERGGAAAAACGGCGSPARGDGAAVELLDPGENPHGTPGGTTRGAGGAAGAAGAGAGAMGGGGVRVASSHGGKGGSAGGSGGGGKVVAGLRQTVLSLTPRKPPPQPQHPGAKSDGGFPAAGGATAAASTGGTEPGPGGSGGGGSGVAVAASLAAVLPSAATAPPLYDTAGRWLGRCRCGVAARARTVKKPGANLGRWVARACGSVFERVGLGTNPHTREAGGARDILGKLAALRMAVPGVALGTVLASSPHRRTGPAPHPPAPGALRRTCTHGPPARAHAPHHGAHAQAVPAGTIVTHRTLTPAHIQALLQLRALVADGPVAAVRLLRLCGWVAAGAGRGAGRWGRRRGPYGRGKAVGSKEDGYASACVCVYVCKCVCQDVDGSPNAACWGGLPFW